MTVERLDLLGAITAYVIFLASIVVFTARIAAYRESNKSPGGSSWSRPSCWST